MSTLFLKKFLKNTVWFKIKPICRQKPIFNTVPLPFQSQSMACAVKVTIIAATDIITMQQLYYFVTAIALVHWRIV